MPEGQSSYICQKFYDSSDIYNADKQEIIRNLWNTLFLCFPVVTTTLDSLCKRCFHLIPEYIDLELIDEAGLKGYSVGGAMISKKHAGFIINKDNATAADVCRLLRDVQDKVKEQFGVQLEPEIQFLGEF